METEQVVPEAVLLPRVQPVIAPTTNSCVLLIDGGMLMELIVKALPRVNCTVCAEEVAPMAVDGKLVGVVLTRVSVAAEAERLKDATSRQTRMRQRDNIFVNQPS